jgi:cytochrome c biogenesis protein CcmG/thiol:disulfide interchange protein DsbE
MAQAQRKKNEKATSSRKTFLIIGAAVLLAAAIAIGFSGGSDDATTQPKTTVEGEVASGEFQPVIVDGDVLSPLGDGSGNPAMDTAMGKTAPTLNGYTFAGNPVSITPGASAQPIMLVFLAHWCPHCNREVPRLIDWQEQGLVPEGLRVIGVTTASRNDQANWPPSDWIEEMKWPFEVFADSEAGDAANAYGVDGFPFIAMVNAEGKIVGRHSGELELADLDAFVKGSLAISFTN